MHTMIVVPRGVQRVAVTEKVTAGNEELARVGQSGGCAVSQLRGRKAYLRQIRWYRAQPSYVMNIGRLFCG
jgi:hypothetical protein